MTEPLDPESDISPDFPFHLHEADILGSKMAYIDTQPERTNGRVALFLHGNPTSSYLWRNVIPHVSPLMRCIAPDLIGMGHSSNPEGLKYTFEDHLKYLKTFIDTVISSESPILLVAYDWGAALGMTWATQQHSSKILGLAVMEFPRPFPTWDDFSEIERVREMFKAFRTPEVGRNLIIDNNAFIEQTLPGGIIRKLTDAEHDYYRRPFRTPRDREPTWAFPNQIPIERHPAVLYDNATRMHDWLLATEVPKLVFWATPGMFITEAKARWYGERLKNAKVVHLGKGVHYLPEDHPKKIGVGIHDWVQSLGLLANES